MLGGVARESLGQLRPQRRQRVRGAGGVSSAARLGAGGGQPGLEKEKGVHGLAEAVGHGLVLHLEPLEGGQVGGDLLGEGPHVALLEVSQRVLLDLELRAGLIELRSMNVYAWET